jgi:hypothetical protein
VKTPNNWRVWFFNRSEPVKVQTDQCNHMHAIAAALDVLKLPPRVRIEARCVELVQPDGTAAATWGDRGVTP